MEQRTVERFRKRAIWIHWLHAAAFAILVITGALMFFDLTGVSGGRQIRILHLIGAVLFVMAPVFYSLFDPKGTVSFLKDGFRWDRDDVAWLKGSVRYYFSSQEQMPPQDRINGDQKLWQLVVILTGLVLALTGIILWFFKLKIGILVYQGVLLTHAAAFVLISSMFLVHFYLRTVHPEFEESLSSMLDGKVSGSYARKHYSKWYDRMIDPNRDGDAK